MNLKQSGFSLIELVIGLTVLSLISVAVGTSFINIFSNQQNVSNQSTINGMNSALNNYLTSDAFCNSSLKGLSVDSTKRPLTIRNFSGIGTAQDISSGSELDDNITLSSSTITFNPSFTAVNTYHEGNLATARLVDIEFNFRYKKAYADGTANRNAQEKWIDRKAQSVTLPVKIQGGVVVACDTSNSPESICASTGGSWDAATQKCNPRESCDMKGNYISWSCTGVRSEYVCGNTLSQALINRGTGIYSQSAQGGTLNKNASSGGVTNPVTGDLSCPSGSSRIFTGQDSASYTLGCGKKCTYTVRQTARFYTCRKCSGD